MLNTYQLVELAYITIELFAGMEVTVLPDKSKIVLAKVHVKAVELVLNRVNV